MAQYPAAVATFTTKQDGDDILAAHVNGLQDEITALTDALLNGVAHAIRPSTTNTRDLGSSALRFRDLFLSRHATIAGDVTANAFVGDGSGLSGVSFVDLINDLSDVEITGPTNGQLLTYNSASGLWENATLSIGGGGVAVLDDLTDVVLTSPAEGQILKYVSGQWINATEGTTPPGVISPYAGSSAPTGWLLCDGSAVSRATYAALYAITGDAYGAGNGTTTFNLPDLRQRFPLGKAASGTGSTLGSTGGAIDHTHSTPAHTHDAGTLGVASHNHAVGTLAVDAHSHAVGTLAAASHTHAHGSLTTGTHAHDLGINGSAASGGAHGHTVSGSTASGGDHSHSVTPDPESSAYDGGSNETPAADSSVSTSTDGAHTHGAGSLAADSGGAHTHTLAGVTESVNLPLTGGVTGATAPAITGATASTAPGMSGNTGSTSPAVNGTTASGGSGTTGTANAPYQVVNYIIKT